MKTQRISSTYSPKALKALEQTLQIHRALIWVNPATNQLAVKRITPVPPAEQVDKAPSMPA